MSRYLITGGCGFVGSNVASALIEEREEVAVFDSLARTGTSDNLAWLQTVGSFKFIHGDIRNADDVTSAVQKTRPSVIFHLAGQVAMTTSLENPRRDYEVNVSGTINVLEAVRHYHPDATVVYSSTNKVYGALKEVTLSEERSRYSAPDWPQGIDETTALDFQTPYGCSKGAADQYVLDYARCFGLKTVVFRHSTIYGSRQFATFDQGWVGWFCRQALETRANPARPRFTISGDGKQVRDLLFVEDAVSCYRSAAEHISTTRGEVFNIGGGVENSLSLVELFAILEKKVGVRLSYDRLQWRPHDQKFFVADITKAKTMLNWQPTVGRDDGLERTLQWLRG
jgi:CDP-paratose 2-epimerase